MTRTITLEQLAADPGAIARDVATNKTRVVLEHNGEPLAALVPMTVLAQDEERESSRKELFEAMDEVSKGFADMTEDEITALVDECVAEVRAERRAAHAAPDAPQAHSA